MSFERPAQTKDLKTSPRGRTNTRVGEVVEYLKNSAVELNQHQRKWRSCRVVTEDRRGSGGDRDNTEMDEVAGELRDEGQLPLPQSGTGQRNSEQSLVCEQGKIPTFQEEPEVSHSGVGSQELNVKGGVT